MKSIIGINSVNIALHFPSNGNIIFEDVRGAKIIADKVLTRQKSDGSFNVLVEFNGQKITFKNVWPKIYVEGSSVNVSATLTKLGQNTYVTAPVGRDQYGTLIGVDLKNKGVNFQPLLNRTTAVTAAVSEPDGGTTLFCAKPEFKFDADKVAQNMTGREPRYVVSTSARTEDDLLLAKNLFEMFPNANHAFIPHRELLVAERESSTDLFRQILLLTDIFQVNEREFNLMQKGEERELSGFNLEDLKKFTHNFNDCGPRVLIVTLGEKGAATVAFCNGDCKVYKHEPCKIGPIVDTTGSGDCFLAGFIAADLEGFTHKKTVKFASWVAAQNGLGFGGHYAKIDEKSLKNFK